jgi:membrane-associated phospholipid phosphatase
VKKMILTLWCIGALCARAQVIDTGNKKLSDTVKKDVLKAPDTVKHLHSSGWSYVPPVALVAYGGLSFVVHPIRRIDYYVKARIARSSPNFNSNVDDYLQVAPAALVYVLNLAGDEGKNRFVDRTALLALSGAILTLADGTKYLAHRVRPYGTDPLSFPSGHTGAAFLTAEFLAQEFGEKSPWYGILGYTCATVTAIYRLYDRAHWFSDDVAGAGFGILSVKASYWLYPHIRNALTHKDKHSRSTMVMPSYQYGVPGLYFAMQL